MTEPPRTCYKNCVMLFVRVITLFSLVAGVTSCAGGEPRPLSDTIPPAISNIRIFDISLTHMDISWTTSEPATSQVEYGEVVYGATTAYGMITPLDKNLVTIHAATLSGLSENTLYRFRVRAKDAAGNEAISEETLQATYFHL